MDQIVLFGYESSPFTWKVRLALRLKQIPYTFMTVPSMMPRPLLRDSFHLTYRKIPVLAIGRELYCDTSIILEALEAAFPNSPSLYPKAADGRTSRSLIRGYASYWTDGPLFRVTTGLIPGSVWRSRFGADRASLIGHKLDAEKLAAKIPRNLVDFDLQLSLIEPQLEEARQLNPDAPWIFPTATPSLADISLFYQLRWARDISAGRGLADLTGNEVLDTDIDVTGPVFNMKRYPSIWHWFISFETVIERLPSTESKVTGSADGALAAIRSGRLRDAPPLLKTAATQHDDLTQQIGLRLGAEVQVAPYDTGRADPTIGTLEALTPEEIVLSPKRLESTGLERIETRIHFPRVGFTVLPASPAKL